MLLYRCLIIPAFVLALAAPVLAGDDHDRRIVVESAWARASIGAGKAGAAYVTLRNTGDHADRLVALATPVAARAELHVHEVKNNIAAMKAINGLDLPAGGLADMRPGGLHVMLFGLKAPLQQGATFPLTLTFAQTGTIEVNIRVAAATARHPAHVDGLHIADAWALPTSGRVGRPTFAYLTIENKSARDDRLLAVATPVAKRAELVRFATRGNVIRELAGDPVELAAGKTHRMRGGGSYIVLSGLSMPLKEGMRFPMTLSLETGGDRTIQVSVGRGDRGGAPRQKDEDVGGHSHADHSHAKGHDKNHVSDSDGHGHGKHDAKTHGVGHGKGNAHGAHDKTIDVEPGPTAPGLALRVERAQDGGWMLLLRTPNFRFAPDKADQSHVAGEGHAHLYVNGEKIGRIYAARHHLAALPAGQAKVTVSLHANSHELLSVGGEALKRTVTVEVP